ncbi:MAG: hypothetical protein ACW98I_21095 [Candidatus Hodarchaeales archaeon]|jgi:hypothetical protein
MIPKSLIHSFLIFLLISAFSLGMGQSSGEPTLSWQGSVGDSRIYQLTKYFDFGTEGNTSLLKSSITSSDGTSYPVILEVGDKIRITITTLTDDNAPIGTILCNNTKVTDVPLSGEPIAPLFFIIKTTDNSSYWENPPYSVEGDYASLYSAYWPAELIFYRKQWKINYLTGWIEYSSFEHFKYDHLNSEYEIQQINATTSSFFQEYGGFIVAVSGVIVVGGVLIVILKYFRKKI